MGDELVVPGDAVAGGSAPVRVFMSYRRADDHHFIGRLHDRLCGAFGDDMVFRDIDSIPAGTNFRTVILRTLNEVDAVVAVIGPNWARPAGSGDVSDYVYLELAEALKQGKPVVPALLEGTPMPVPDTLPPDLRALTEIHAIAIHGDPAFRRDTGRLIDAVRDVVTSDRARIAQERIAAEESARRIEAERAERARLTDELRAEERAARVRLAELEEVATRRQIELETARLDAIAEQLRLAEAGIEADIEVSAAAPEQSDVEDAAPVITPDVEPPSVIAPPEPSPIAPAVPRVAWRSSGGRGLANQLPLQVLLVAAIVLGVVALSRNRSTETPFNELSYGWQIDVSVWILTLAIGIPLLLAHRPVHQRFVLTGVAASAFFFEFLQASALVRYGTTRYDEGSWLVLKSLQALCLLGAIWMVRRRASESLPSSPPVKVALVAMAAACGALVVAAMRDQWSEAETLIESGFLKDRTPFAVWVVFLVVGPVGLTLVLAMRPSFGARVALATIAPLAAVNYFAEAAVVDQVFHVDGSLWIWTSLAYVLLAVVAWWTVVTRPRTSDPTQ